MAQDLGAGLPRAGRSAAGSLRPPLPACFSLLRTDTALQQPPPWPPWWELLRRLPEAGSGWLLSRRLLAACGSADLTGVGVSVILLLDRSLREQKDGCGAGRAPAEPRCSGSEDPST